MVYTTAEADFEAKTANLLPLREVRIGLPFKI
jgi:hypothetical protein